MRPRALAAAFSCALATFAFASLVACGDNQQPEQAADLWARIVDADVDAWARAPGYEKRRASSQPHGEMVDIFVNDTVATGLATKPKIDEWPVGSWIVKKGYDGGDLEFVNSMEKLEDGWFWAEFGGQGDAKYSGKPSVCLDCHATGSDYVRAFKLP